MTAMSVIAAFMMMALAVPPQPYMPALATITDCRSLLVPMAYAPPRGNAEKRTRSKQRPSQRPAPAQRPCLVLASA
jgi:hypothetical protein